MGQIESNLQGDPNDLSNAALVPLCVVELANNGIISEGQKKLAAMSKTVEYRRTMLWREWRHRCMRITLQDMREELKLLQGVEVTKEIQNYLLTYPGNFGDVEKEKKEKTCELIVTKTCQV